MHSVLAIAGLAGLAAAWGPTDWPHGEWMSHTAGWANDNGDWASQTAAASAGETPNVWSSLAAEFTPSAYQNTWTSTAAYSSPTSSWTSSGSAAPTTWSGATPAYSTSPVWSSYIPTSSLSTAVAPYPTPYASEAHAWETGNAANITAAPTHTMETHTHSSWHDTYGTTVMHSGLATHTGAPIVSATVNAAVRYQAGAAGVLAVIGAVAAL